MLTGLAAGIIASAVGAIIGGINSYQSHKTAQYNKNLNKLTMQREDTAYQRKVADLQAAGLNPALALGGGADASAGAQIQAPRVENEDSYVQQLSTLMGMEQMSANIDNLHEQNANLRQDNALKIQQTGAAAAQAALLNAQRAQTNVATGEMSRNYKIYSDAGVSSLHPQGWAQNMADILGMLNEQFGNDGSILRRFTDRMTGRTSDAENTRRRDEARERAEQRGGAWIDDPNFYRGGWR